MRQERKERSLKKSTPPAGGMARSLSNLTPLNRSTGKLCFTCPICGISFLKPAAWARKTNNHYCSRACSAEGHKIRVTVNCVVCEKEMESTPGNVGRITTCSKKCSSLRRRSDSPRLQSFAAYKTEVAKIAAGGVCVKCGIRHGPWVVRGVHTLIAGDGMPVIDADHGVLWCRRCHLSDLAPIGGAANAARLLQLQKDSRSICTGSTSS